MSSFPYHPWLRDFRERTLYVLPYAETSAYPFVSYCRQNVLTAVPLIIRGARDAVREGFVDELFANGLSDDFRPGGQSSDNLDRQILRELAWTFGTYDTARRMTRRQAFEFAQLGVALMNFDVRHLRDNTPMFFTLEQRYAIEDLILLCSPELMKDLLYVQPDIFLGKAARSAQHA